MSGGQSSLPVQSLLTLAAGVTGSIGSALVADPGRVVEWIDTASPSSNACCLILAIDRLSPILGILAAAGLSSHAVPLMPTIFQPVAGWTVTALLALLVSFAMNFIWLTEGPQLRLRCRTSDALAPPSADCLSEISSRHVSQAFLYCCRLG